MWHMILRRSRKLVQFGNTYDWNCRGETAVLKRLFVMGESKESLIEELADYCVVQHELNAA